MKRELRSAVVVTSLLLFAAQAFGSASTSLDKCQKTVKTEAAKFVTGTVKAVEGCLAAISKEVVSKNAAVAAAAPACVKAFRKLNSTASPTKTLAAKMRAKLVAKCAPGQTGVEHTLADVLGPGAGVPQSIEAQNVNFLCASFGGDGSLDNLTEWLDCIEASGSCAAYQAIATDYPRALEWFDLLQPAMAALAPLPTDAIAELAAVNGAIEGGADDDIPGLQCSGSCGDGIKNGFDQCDGADLDGASCSSLGYTFGVLTCGANCGFDAADCSGPPALPCGNGVKEGAEACDSADFGSTTCLTLGHTGGTLACTTGCGLDASGCSGQALVATGQIDCWDGGTEIACAGTGQDGDIRAGAPLAYRDNGDGTITDLNTKLVWEKKSNNGDIHDVNTEYSWTSAVTVHVAGLNTASFAGYSDWRLPNRKELVNLLDISSELGNNINVVFNGTCSPGCSVTTCSCSSASSPYWSSTTSAAQPNSAWLVDLDGPFSDQVPISGKANAFPVRAVRGGP